MLFRADIAGTPNELLAYIWITRYWYSKTVLAGVPSVASPLTMLVNYVVPHLTTATSHHPMSDLTSCDL